YQKHCKSSARSCLAQGAKPSPTTLSTKKTTKNTKKPGFEPHLPPGDRVSCRNRYQKTDHYNSTVGVGRPT
ncbi:MAG: hypothetical protein NZ739_12275, partial [Verrucomicrobiae bacterium]|nr:hypothetical protein [Verrucomicrobiae bacterium]